jgi:hypothetical protein
MPIFPALKTNAVAQYPASRAVQYQNQTLRFLDGNEQRYRDTSGPLHKWAIRLDELDEGELAALDSFFLNVQGQFGSFTFVDPWDGTSYANCSVDAAELELTSTDSMRGKTQLTVVENRG